MRPGQVRAETPAAAGRGILIRLDTASSNVAKLALRSEDILTNQVYRFSERFVADNARAYRMTRIDPSVDMRRYRLHDPVLGQGEMTCAAWKALDRKIDNPVRFSPRYMRCLIDYGRVRATQQAWWRAMEAR